MAITRTETQITWSAAAFVDVTSTSSQTSDAATLDDTCVSASITLKADNSTTPASDDIISFWWLMSAGDPDGASTVEYDTTGHALLLATLDTSVEDPAIRTVALPSNPKRGTLYAEGITAGSTNTIRVSATIEEQRAA